MKGRAGEKGNQGWPKFHCIKDKLLLMHMHTLGDQGFPGPRGVLGLKGMQGKHKTQDC